MSRATLRAEDLRVVLGSTEVLRGVSLSLAPGWTAIVGPNGAGKSTLLRMLSGLLAPASGTVWLGERALAQLTSRERSRQVSWLDQKSEGSNDLSVRDIVRLGRLPHLGLFTAPAACDETAVDEALAACECSAWQHRRLQELSGGERQRALLARALAVQAPVMLLDEPTTHLDPPHQVALVRLLRRLARDHTLASVLHDLPLALQADRIVVMSAGRVVAEGGHDDAAVHAALMAVFDQAISIQRLGERFIAVPNLDGD
jgi:iron complex transport system ATP-binding protein